ncbi:MAG: FG-GAP repeat protein [Thermoplasmata archaeon]|nr:FG-GAP repeat protein [Thermoplasmata archaeon]
MVDGLFEEWTNPVKDDKGNVFNPNVDLTNYDTACEEKFGSSVAVGDFDGNSKVNDILVGASEYGSYNRGRAYIFYNGSGGYSVVDDILLESKGDLRVLEPAGNENLSDLIVSAQTAANFINLNQCVSITVRLTFA